MSALNLPQPDFINHNVASHYYDPRSRVDTNDQMTIWLKSLGLQFNPFFALNAADDSHLSEYLIELEIFEAVWGNWISFVFEQAGGGKTALRVRTSQACWNTRDINRPFPIPYSPPFLKWGTVTPTYYQHLVELTQTGAVQLFLGLCHHPEWFFDLNLTIQQKVAEVMAWSLSVESLKYYLDELQATHNLEALRQEFDPTFKTTTPFDLTTAKKFYNVLSGQLDNIAPAPDTPDIRWSILGELLLDHLGFPSIYILLDGLDNTIETATDPHLALVSLTPLLPMLDIWAERRIFFKGFLPIEVKSVISPQLLAQSRTVSIDWDATKLAKLICQRVFVASTGAFSSLDALVTPSLRGFEDMVIESVIAMRPREVLTLINDVFSAHLRLSGVAGKIDEADWKAGLTAYQRNAFQPVNL